MGLRNGGVLLLRNHFRLEIESVPLCFGEECVPILLMHAEARLSFLSISLNCFSEFPKGWDCSVAFLQLLCEVLFQIIVVTSPYGSSVS